ncbi:MAG: hypothetical protein JWM80_2318 [Cyanobacteria bacterium RYN_339]|nr:hypothetical protein [Cyanobacteria bacterium RYN_339]
MALQNNPVGYASNGGYPPAANAGFVPAPAGNAPGAINTVDQYAGTPALPATGVAPSSLGGGLMSHLGIGSLIGALGGGLLGARVILPRLALRLAPKVPPSMWLKFGVIGGSALAGAWLLSKLLGGSKAAAAVPAQQA